MLVFSSRKLKSIFGNMQIRTRLEEPKERVLYCIRILIFPCVFFSFAKLVNCLCQKEERWLVLCAIGKSSGMWESTHAACHMHLQCGYLILIWSGISCLDQTNHLGMLSLCWVLVLLFRNLYGVRIYWLLFVQTVKDQDHGIKAGIYFDDCKMICYSLIQAGTKITVWFRVVTVGLSLSWL